MNDELFKIFTDDMAEPFTTIKCPKCGYRGQVTSECAIIAGQFMTGSCDWCEYESPIIAKGKGQTDFLVETWICDKPAKGNKTS